MAGVVLLLAWLSPLGAQQLLDRIVARVNGVPVTLTDVKAAIALGIVVAPESAAIEQLIDRQLVLNEVARFVPPEPAAAAVAVEAGLLLTQAGAKNWAWIAFTDIAVFFGVLMVGFFYLWRRGDIDWVRAVPEPPLGKLAELPVKV